MSKPKTCPSKLEYQRAYREKNRDRIRTLQKIERQKPEARAKSRAYMEQYRNRPGAKEKRKEWFLSKLYGITIKDFENILNSQGGVCAICKTKDWGKLGPAIDHDHNHGEVRGILCNRCNVAIGMLRDDPTLAILMASYLVRTK